jgi:hypothetical protein
VRPLLVEIFLPQACLQASIRLADDVGLLQVLISQLAIETLAHSVLPGWPIAGS